MSEVTELSIDPVSRQELAAFKLIADTQFYEYMGSESFNRKLTGIVPPGIYRGFDFSITGDDRITVCTGDKNTAAVERDGQMITVQGQHPIELVIPRGEELAVVLEAISQHGLLTSQIDKNSEVLAAQVRIVPIADIENHHLIVLTVNLPNDVALNDEHISIERRTVGGLNNTPTFEQANELFQPKGDYIPQSQILQGPEDKRPNAMLHLGAHGLGTEFKVLGTANKKDHTRFVIGLVDVTNAPNDVFSHFSGKIDIMRSNGVEPPIVLDVVMQKVYNEAFATANISIRDNLTFQDISGIKGCLFTYNGKRYAGIDIYVSATAKDFILISGLFAGRTEPFIVEYRNISSSQVYNAEVSGSIQYSIPGYCGRAYTQANIVGSVGQIGGAPTGAVMQRGSNPNGDFTRFADGTLHCRFFIARGVIPYTLEGSLYVSAEIGWTFPVAFDGNIIPFADCTSGGVGSPKHGEVTALSKTFMNSRMVKNISGNDSTFANLYAFGYWYSTN